MDWNARILAALAECSPAPDPDVVEELAQHAEAAYHASRAGGRSREEADAATSALIRDRSAMPEPCAGRRAARPPWSRRLPQPLGSRASFRTFAMLRGSYVGSRASPSSPR